jgi:hypothetical protein
MKLSAPTQIVFLISLVVAIIGVLIALGVLTMIPVASVWVMVIAYIILAGGCLFKGV